MNQPWIHKPFPGEAFLHKPFPQGKPRLEIAALTIFTTRESSASLLRGHMASSYLKKRFNYGAEWPSGPKFSTFYRWENRDFPIWHQPKQYTFFRVNDYKLPWLVALFDAPKMGNFQKTLVQKKVMNRSDWLEIDSASWKSSIAKFGRWTQVLVLAHIGFPNTTLAILQYLKKDLFYMIIPGNLEATGSLSTTRNVIRNAYVLLSKSENRGF